MASPLTAARRCCTLSRFVKAVDYATAFLQDAQAGPNAELRFKAEARVKGSPPELVTSAEFERVYTDDELRRSKKALRVNGPGYSSSDGFTSIQSQSS